ncbi:hypothetical protein MMPV_009757 [Pyropia vietnamensis]
MWAAEEAAEAAFDLPGSVVSESLPAQLASPAVATVATRSGRSFRTPSPPRPPSPVTPHRRPASVDVAAPGDAGGLETPIAANTATTDVKGTLTVSAKGPPTIAPTTAATAAEAAAAAASAVAAASLTRGAAPPPRRGSSHDTPALTTGSTLACDGRRSPSVAAREGAAELAVVPYLATADMPPVLSAPAGVSGIADEAEVAPAVPFLRTLSLTSVGVTHVPALPPRPAPLQPVVSSPALADAGVAPAVEQALTGRAPDASEGGGDSAVDVARKCGNAMWTGSYPAGAAIPTSPTPMAAVVPPISSRPSSPLLRPGWIAGDGGSGGGGGWGGFRPGP